MRRALVALVLVWWALALVFAVWSRAGGPRGPFAVAAFCCWAVGCIVLVVRVSVRDAQRRLEHIGQAVVRHPAGKALTPPPSAARGAFWLGASNELATDREARERADYQLALQKLRGIRTGVEQRNAELSDELAELVRQARR